MCLRNSTRAALLAFCFCCAAAAQPQCSIQDVVGLWSLSGMGWVVFDGQPTPVPVAMIGMGVIDNQGKVTGPFTITTAAAVPGTPFLAGQPLDFDMVNATIQVNPDCSGLLKSNVQLRGTPGPAIGPYIDRVVVIRTQDEIVGGEPAFEAYVVYTMKRISHVPTPVSWPGVSAK